MNIFSNSEAVRLELKNTKEKIARESDISGKIPILVGEVGLEPTRLLRPADFKSAAYTNSAIRPHIMEAPAGVAPAYAVLQTAA